MNIKQFIYTILLTSITYNASAYMLCGKMVDSNGTINAVWKSDDSGNSSISGQYKCNNLGSMATKLYNGNFDFVCINYSSISGNIMTSCSFENYFCGPTKTLDYTTPKCISCPTGVMSYQPNVSNPNVPEYYYGYNNTPNCKYCPDENNYYDTATNTCKPCPGNGKSAKYNDVIYGCYITLEDGEDETGKYTWPMEKCYWE